MLLVDPAAFIAILFGAVVLGAGIIAVGFLGYTKPEARLRYLAYGIILLVAFIICLVGAVRMIKERVVSDEETLSVLGLRPEAQVVCVRGVLQVRAPLAWTHTRSV